MSRMRPPGKQSLAGMTSSSSDSLAAPAPPLSASPLRYSGGGFGAAMARRTLPSLNPSGGASVSAYAVCVIIGGTKAAVFGGQLLGPRLLMIAWRWPEGDWIVHHHSPLRQASDRIAQYTVFHRHYHHQQ